MLFIELSGDLPEPIIGSRCIEVESLIEIFGGKLIECSERYALVESERKEELAYRLAMAHYVYEYLGTPEKILREEKDSFVVYRSSLGSRAGGIKEALEIAKLFVSEVDLRARRKLFVFYTNSGIHVATDPIPTGRRFLYKRVPARRPINKPPTLDPYHARFLVNLSRVKPSDRLLDPFCGYGGILLEARDVRAKPVGIDIKLKALRGASLNFYHFFHERPQLILGDSTRDLFNSMHVATDPPRGKMLKSIEARYEFLENTSAERISAVLGYQHEIIGKPIYVGRKNSGRKTLYFVVYRQ